MWDVVIKISAVNDSVTGVPFQRFQNFRQIFGQIVSR